jgi:RNA polymerase sigma-70 factor (ECF subfamily)
MSLDQLNLEFEDFRSQLESFILRMTASRQDTQDIVQETYLRASDKINTFKAQSSLKTWVFAIAGNLARDLLRAQKRWPENVTDIAKDAALSNPTFFRKRWKSARPQPRAISRTANTSRSASPVSHVHFLLNNRSRCS